MSFEKAYQYDAIELKIINNTDVMIPHFALLIDGRKLSKIKY